MKKSKLDLCPLLLLSILALSLPLPVLSSSNIKHIYPTHLQASSPTFTFFHISDVHFDPLSNPVLYNQTTFCRPDSYVDRLKDINHKHSSKYDGLFNTVPNYFGRYGCDTPEALFNSTLEAMVKTQPHPDFIIYTGDSPAHKLVDDEQIYAIKFVAEALSSSFPGVLVVPSIGNNDVYPDYSVVCNDTRLQNLYSAYHNWIPTDQAATFTQMGSFAVSPQPSLLVISLNTILYSARNSAGNVTDPCGQFAWLEAQLKSARSGGMQVYITGHILPGMDPDYYIPLWVPAYTSYFVDLILSYTDVIEAMLFGHVHRDEFRILNPPPGSKAQPTQLSSLVTGSSFSPIYDNNPSFRLYSYNKSYTLLDYDEIYMDLFIANFYGEANWTKEYSYSDYGAGPVGTASLSALFIRLQNNPSLFSEWYDRRVAQYQEFKQETLCAVSAPFTADFEVCLQQGGDKK